MERLKPGYGGCAELVDSPIKLDFTVGNRVGQAVIRME